VLRCVDQAQTPLASTAIRAALHCKSDLLEETLLHLTTAGTLVRQGDLWMRAPRSAL
jgi:hypothetical protein